MIGSISFISFSDSFSNSDSNKTEKSKVGFDFNSLLCNGSVIVFNSWCSIIGITSGSIITGEVLIVSVFTISSVSVPYCQSFNKIENRLDFLLFLISGCSTISRVILASILGCSMICSGSTSNCSTIGSMISSGSVFSTIGSGSLFSITCFGSVSNCSIIAITCSLDSGSCLCSILGTYFVSTCISFSGSFSTSDSESISSNKREKSNVEFDFNSLFCNG